MFSQNGCSRCQVLEISILVFHTILQNKSALPIGGIDQKQFHIFHKKYSNVITLVANVKAQQQAVVSATSALEATSVGYKVGTRNVVDLLQAEKNLYSAEKNLANAKYDYILANLRLALASGTISPQNIIDINNLLN